MITTPQSIPGRYPQPASILLLLSALVVLKSTSFPVTLQAQGSSRAVLADTDFLKEMGGPTVLARLLKGSSLLAGAPKGGWAEVTLDGWIAAGAVHDEKREGFDVAVSLPAGSPVRAGAGTGATLATAKLGALFNRISTKGAWVHVRRTGWVAADRLTPALAASAAAVAKDAAPAGMDGTLMGGTALFTQPGGSQVGTFETPFTAKVLEQKDGWTRVQLELWVRDEALGSAGNPGGLTAAAIRADPDKYVGQSVEWTLQVLALQKADELRPELPLGQPYVLARGPLPEAGLVYLVIPAAEVERFAALGPLVKIRVQATVRAGRARHLPTPVLDFVRRIN